MPKVPQAVWHGARIPVQVCLTPEVTLKAAAPRCLQVDVLAPAFVYLW